MKNRCWSASLLLALAVVNAGFSSPLPVGARGAGSQSTVMCPDCKEKVACAKAGDYTVGFTADVENVKSGASKVYVHVKDKANKPVDDARVTVALDMPRHGHNVKSLALKSVGHGAYQASTSLVMPGEWKATVEVTPATGDTVRQEFSFRK